MHCFFGLQGRIDEVLEQSAAAERLDPLAFEGTRAMALLQSRRYQAAIAILQQLAHPLKTVFSCTKSQHAPMQPPDASPKPFSVTEQCLRITGQGVSLARRAFDSSDYAGLQRFYLADLRQPAAGGHVFAVAVCRNLYPPGSARSDSRMVEQSHGATFLSFPRGLDEFSARAPERHR